MTAAPERTDPAKWYLGDAVYVAIDDGLIVLTTENGIGTTNTIYLEPPVLAAFIAWIRHRRAVESAGVL